MSLDQEQGGIGFKKMKVKNFFSSIFFVYYLADIYSYIPKSFLAEAYQLTLSNQVSPMYHEEIHCYVYTQDEGFCVRTNTLANYAEANRQVIMLLLVPISTST